MSPYPPEVLDELHGIFVAFNQLICSLSNLPFGMRELSLSKTKLEESEMWAEKVFDYPPLREAMHARYAELRAQGIDPANNSKILNELAESCPQSAKV